MTTALTREQLKGILMSKKLGRWLIRHHPEIVDEWANGKTTATISQQYIPAGHSSVVAQSAVGYAIHQLLEPVERARIGKQHVIEACKRKGLEDALIGRAVFSLSEEEKRESYRKSAIAQGRVPYTSIRQTEHGVISERDYVLKLRSEKIVVREIVRRTNEIYRNGRTQRSIEGYIGLLRRTEQIPKIDNTERIGRALETRGTATYTEEKRLTEFGEITEAEYLIKLREQGNKLEVVASKINCIFNHNRSKDAIVHAYAKYRGR